MLTTLFQCALALVALRTPPPPAPVYYCASGYLVKYHATDRCWGLRRCNATIKKRSLAEARKRRQEPCKLCY